MLLKRAACQSLIYVNSRGNFPILNISGKKWRQSFRYSWARPKTWAFWGHNLWDALQSFPKNGGPFNLVRIYEINYADLPSLRAGLINYKSG